MTHAAGANGEQMPSRWDPDASPVRLILCGHLGGVHRGLDTDLRDAGFSVVPALTESEVRTAIEAEPASVVVIADGEDGVGLDLLRGIVAQAPHVLAVLIAARGSIEHAVEAVKAGAYDYVARPAQSADLLPVLRRAAERARREPTVQSGGPATMIGVSAAWRHMVEVAKRAAATDAAVLLRGEAGSGKRSLARAIHAASPRAHGPFVVADELARGEEPLDIDSLSAEAAGGTLYVHESAALPLPQQERLLRILRDGENGPAPCGVRVIASSGQNLMGLAAQGKFNEALYYRLSVIPIDLPPLRARQEDLPLLARHFLLASAQRHGRTAPTISDDAMACLLSHGWPGNVAELEATMERLTILARKPVIGVEDLPPELRRDQPVLPRLRMELPEQGISLDGVERELIQRALDRYRGNQTHAARYLGISRKTLIYRMEKHRLRSR
ncbi:MAG: sigma-54-dependent Fis family transcriptional regulator [Bryobacterales bacterium]|nr:sigma-54-dependent Fis family transcriptional regulator [Bryobacterales bacterium]